MAVARKFVPARTDSGADLSCLLGQMFNPEVFGVIDRQIEENRDAQEGSGMVGQDE